MISLFQCKDTKKYLKMREINEEYSIPPIFFRAKCQIPPNGVDGIRIEKVPTRFNLPALLVSVRVVLRHATRHA